MNHIINDIDHVLRDWAISADAMRWIPGPQAAEAAEDIIEINTLVTYHGSIEGAHGTWMVVHWQRDDSGQVRYELGAGEDLADPDLAEAPLIGVRRQSITPLDPDSWWDDPTPTRIRLPRL